MDDKTIVLGIFVDLLAAPFFYEGTAALMSKLWIKAFIAHAIGIPAALIGLTVFGVFGNTYRTAVAAWIYPVAADPRWWILVLLFALLWIGAPHFVDRVRAATQREIPLRAGAIQTPAYLLTLRVWRLDERVPDWNNKITYKAKLSVIFRNDGVEGIDLRSPRWLGVATQSPFAFAYSLEKTTGECDWSPQEFGEVRLDPGRSARLWIGLDPKIPHDQLAKQYERVKLRAITIPMMVNGRMTNAEYQV
jgi:hypothetical protein